MKYEPVEVGTGRVLLTVVHLLLVFSCLCCMEFLWAPLPVKAFLGSSSQSAQLTLVPFHRSAIFHIIEHGVLMTHLFC